MFCFWLEGHDASACLPVCCLSNCSFLHISSKQVKRWPSPGKAQFGATIAYAIYDLGPKDKKKGINLTRC